MSILGLYADWYYEPADLIDDDDDAQIFAPVETLTFSALGGWWSAGPDLTDDEE